MIKSMDKIPVPPLSEFLIEEFLKPMGLTAIDLSKGTGIPITEVYGLLRDEIEMTPELSAKIGTFFGISENVFYKLQNSIRERMYRQSSPMFDTVMQEVKAV